MKTFLVLILCLIVPLSVSAFVNTSLGFGDEPLDPSSATAVEITFRVHVPANTPQSDTVYIAGDFNGWDPHALKMTSTVNGEWSVSASFGGGGTISYKYTRGSWNSVEKGSLGEELPNRQIDVPDTNIVVTDTVLKWSDVVDTAPTPGSGAPDRFYLAQNYPNPFNPTTAVSFQLSAVSEVKLVVYDMLGREVAMLVNEKKAPGSYEVTFDAAGLASGMYFYRLTAGSFAQVRKMVHSR